MLKRAIGIEYRLCNNRDSGYTVRDVKGDETFIIDREEKLELEFELESDFDFELEVELILLFLEVVGVPYTTRRHGIV